MLGWMLERKIRELEKKHFENTLKFLHLLYDFHEFNDSIIRHVIGYEESLKEDIA